MNFDLGTDRMDWRDEISWLVIAGISGMLMSLLFAAFDRFPGAGLPVVMLLCCVGFYVLSILLRLQNHRGEFWLGRTIVREGRLKLVFPAVGFVVGLALLFL